MRLRRNALKYENRSVPILYSGTLNEEIVWLGDTPLATLRPKTGGGVDLYYIHSDHLNTPRLITDASGNSVRWKWDAEPFGGGVPSENPSGAGAFALDLRFPGQMHIAETGLRYNYYRDGYDPATGGYTQSDPIGIWGGFATYGYALGNPVVLIDPTGLDGQCPAAPSYNPRGIFNTLEGMTNNNCYSYGRNKPDSDLAPPGLVFDDMTCEQVIAASIKAGMSKPDANGNCPSCTHKVFLLIESDRRDFHWYCQDSDGWWSHKLADDPASNKDASGRRIRNPRSADSNYGPGNNYSTPCGYLCTPN